MTPKTMTPRTPGAVLYARVSTGEQAQHGTSLAGQRDACRLKALALGLPIVAEYEDVGISGGFLLTRQGMQAALADVRAGRASTLICANLSRFSRDVEHQQALKKAVRAAGGQLVFCDMTFEDTPEGDLNFTIQGGFAEYEKAVIKKRTYAGRVRKAQAGIQTARVYSPMGYHIVSPADVLRGLHPAALLGTYLVVESEADLVRNLFARYGGGVDSLTTLARWLNTSGVPTRISASAWRVNAVRYILSNPVYKGEAAFGKRDHREEEGRIGSPHPLTGKPMTGKRITTPADPSTWITWPVPALVPSALWERVQAKFGENRSKQGGNPRRVRMLAGRIFCPVCDAPLHVMHTPKRIASQQNSYVCAEYRKRSADPNAPGCLPTLYPVSVIEEAALGAMLDAAARPWVVAEAQAVYRQKALEEQKQAENGVLGDLGDGFKQIENALLALERRQAAAVEAQIAGVMAGADPAAYGAVFGDIAEKRLALEVRHAELQSREAAGPVSPAPAARKANPATEDKTTAELLEDMARVLRSNLVTDAKKREIIGTVIAAVRPLREGKAYQREGGWGAEVEFLPGALEDAGEAVQDHMSQTFQLSGKKCCLNFIVA